MVAGREPPRWAEPGCPDPTGIPKEYIDVQLVGYLPDADADKYLQNAGIVDTSMRQCLIAYARAKPAQCHPYLLGLCADVVLAALAKGKILTPDDFRLGLDLDQKAKRLVHRLLSYVEKEIQPAVEALSACRAFDETIYFTLGKSLKFHATTPGFEVLTGFSFVENLGHGLYRFHNLLSRFMRELEYYEVTSKADGVLENYYRARGEAGDISAVPESIYHANRLDWKRGATDWVKTFERALSVSRFEVCRVLLDVRMELSIRGELERGQIARCAADYFACLSRYAEANQEYLDAIHAFEEALQRKPDDADILNNIGIALRGIGELAASFSRFGEAAQSYEQAIASFDQALVHAPGGCRHSRQ